MELFGLVRPTATGLRRPEGINLNLANFLLRTAKSMNDQPAVALGSNDLHTYLELARRAGALATQLRDRFRLSPGDRVALFIHLTASPAQFRWRGWTLTNRAIDHAKENHITIQRRHPQTGLQIGPADVAEWGTANPLALIALIGQPGIGPTVLGDVVADVEQVLPGFWRKSYGRHQAARLPLALADCFGVEGFGSA